MLSELSEQLQQLGRILTRASSDDVKPERQFVNEFAELLDCLAEAVSAYGGSASRGGEIEPARQLQEALGAARSKYDDLARQTESAQQRALSVEGAMLVASERTLRLLSGESESGAMRSGDSLG